MVKLLIVGPNGKMGRALVRHAATEQKIDLVGAVGPEGRGYIGADLGFLVGLGRATGAQVVDDILFYPVQRHPLRRGTLDAQGDLWLPNREA